MNRLQCCVLLALWACCRAQGNRCGPAPIIPNAEIVGSLLPFYISVTGVQYKCQALHKMVGNSRVNCLNGAWSELPECLEPCTTSPEEMAMNNLKLKWAWDQKIYVALGDFIAHGDFIEFDCISRAFVRDETLPFRTQCNRGQMGYPKCIPIGSCVVSTSAMNANNLIIQTEKVEIKNGETVEFSCKSGFQRKPTQEMTANCLNGRLEYPQCESSSCVISTSAVKANNLILQTEKAEIKNGETVEFSCKSGFQRKPTQEMTATCLNRRLEYPQCERITVCGAAPQVQHASIVDQPKQSYTSGERVTYKCQEENVVENLLHVTCTDGEWRPVPVCRKFGDKCGPAPSIPNGDITGTQQEFFDSGAFVSYTCQALHQMLGASRVTCLHGAWSALPECLEPCTVRPDEMAANNIRLRWTAERKLYSEHGAFVEFECTSSDYIKDETLPFRFPCLRGQLMYPRCIRRGSCVALTHEMEAKNLMLYKESKEITNGESVEFTCKPGFYRKPNQELRATCRNGVLQYPECHSSTCQVTSEKLAEHNLELTRNHMNRMSFLEGEVIKFSCKYGSKAPRRQSLFVKCTLIGLEYPTCINPNPCRIIQEAMDQHNLELDEIHEDSIVYQNGDFIGFKCKPAFFETGPLLGTCIQNKITYPTCVLGRPCLMSQDVIARYNIQLLPEHANKQYIENGDSVEFRCKDGFQAHRRSNAMAQICDAGHIKYPTCVSA
ncbi:complement factor H-like [Ambystoma mexicanum]|uniref:complement factor H-like n=1 Tax=Ambystoma mexicanum TaxID=8296 RepID=UPI0037E9BB2C